MINPIKNDSINNYIAYAVTWRNADRSHFHVPYPGHASVIDFLDFYNDPYTLFESDLPDMYSLPKEDLSAPILTSFSDSHIVSAETLTEIKV
jgi:mannan endo-1,4-beta-mannosidase